MSLRNWHEIALGDVIRQRKESIVIADDEPYRRVRVQLHGRGIVLRDEVHGRDIKTKKQFPIKAGDLLVAEIDAKAGGYGVVSEELAGAIVSSHYFLYEVDADQLDLGFLNYWLKTPAPLEQVKGFVKGSLNYAAIRPYHFSQLKIRVPESLAEQRRIVARIDSILSAAGRAEQFKGQVEKELNDCLTAAYREITAEAERLPFGEVAQLQRRSIEVKPDGVYEELGVRSFGKGTFHKPALTGTEVGGKRIFQIVPGDLLFNIVFAWEGAVAVVKPEDQGRVGSHRFLTYVPDERRATANFLAFHFLTRKGLEDLGKASPGAAGRNKTLGVRALEKIEVPLPALKKQLWFDEILSRRAEIQRIQGETQTELNALLPAILDRAFKGEL
jgi:type I restriction enzyme, S subunit